MLTSVFCVFNEYISFYLAKEILQHKLPQYYEVRRSFHMAERSTWLGRVVVPNCFGYCDAEA